MLCQVTSKPFDDSGAVVLDEWAFASGSLPVTSYARPGKLFTASSDLITEKSTCSHRKREPRIIDAVVALIRAEIPMPTELDPGQAIG